MMCFKLNTFFIGDRRYNQCIKFIKCLKEAKYKYKCLIRMLKIYWTSEGKTVFLLISNAIWCSIYLTRLWLPPLLRRGGGTRICKSHTHHSRYNFCTSTYLLLNGPHLLRLMQSEVRPPGYGATWY